MTPLKTLTELAFHLPMQFTKSQGRQKTPGEARQQVEGAIENLAVHMLASCGLWITGMHPEDSHVQCLSAPASMQGMRPGLYKARLNSMKRDTERQAVPRSHQHAASPLQDAPFSTSFASSASAVV